MGLQVRQVRQQGSALRLQLPVQSELLQVVQTQPKYSLSRYLKAQPAQPDRREVMVAMVAMAQQPVLEHQQPRQALLV